MDRKSRVLKTFLGVGGFLILVGILYQTGIRITPISQDDKGGQQLGQDQELSRMPGQDRQREVKKQSQRRGQTGSGGRNQKVVITEGSLGGGKIVILAGGKETSFTGEDLESMEPITVASNRGGRKGWSAVDVLKRFGVTEAMEVIFINKEGETLRLPWGKVTGTDPTLILAYNRSGGLLLLSGVPLTEDQLQTASRRDVRAVARENRKDRIFFANIVKIEAKI